MAASMASPPSPVSATTAQGERFDALLRGVVPVLAGSSQLASAYTNALSFVRARSETLAAHAELTPAELVSLLKADESAGPPNAAVRLLALEMLVALAATPAEDVHHPLHVALEVGLLPALFDYLVTACARIEAGAREHSLLMQTHKAAQLVCTLSCEAFFPDDTAHTLPNEDEIRLLSTAAAAICRVVGAASGPGLPAQELSITIALLKAHYFLECHDKATPETQDASWDGPFADPGFIRACGTIIERAARTEAAQQASRALYYGCNTETFRATLSSAGALQRCMDALSSTVQDVQTLEYLLGVVSNFSAGGLANSLLLCEAGALSLIQPAVRHELPVIAVNAAFCIACLACFKEVAARSECNDALHEVCDMLQARTPGAFRMKATFGSSDVPSMLQVLDKEAQVPVQLAGLHMFAACIHVERNQQLFNQPALTAALRACAASSDAFVYSAAAFMLQALDLPIPSFRPKKMDLIMDARRVTSWSIDHVCAWVGTQPFRAYRQAFRDGFVNGKLLLSLTDADLSAVGITHPLHRRAILFAVQELQEQEASAAGSDDGTVLNEGDASAIALHRSPSMSVKPTGVDIFISYRRKGGSDFAQLLKVVCKSAGYDVFLDVDNLGTGFFDVALRRNLENAKNVVCVWTPGCMDRFLDEHDSGTSTNDFVRMEYALAIRLRKNIIPVVHDQFVFPDPARLPSDVRDIMSYNAVQWVPAYRDASFDKLRKALIL